MYNKEYNKEYSWMKDSELTSVIGVVFTEHNKEYLLNKLFHYEFKDSQKCKDLVEWIKNLEEGFIFLNYFEDDGWKYYLNYGRDFEDAATDHDAKEWFEFFDDSVESNELWWFLENVLIPY